MGRGKRKTKLVGSEREGKRKTGSKQALSGKGKKEDRKLAGSLWEDKKKTRSSILCVGRQKEDRK